MSDLSKKYNKIFDEIESKISNQEEKEFVKEKIMELATLFLDAMDNLTERTERKITRMEEKQNEIEDKINQVNNVVDEIENTIFEEDDDDYDFQITCPYCNSDFVADIAGKNEIECPECKNTIELDWNDEEEESNSCKRDCKSCDNCSNNSQYIDNTKNIIEDDDDDM